MKQRLAILGSTGSIGMQTLDIVRENPDRFEARILTAHGNWEQLARQAREFDADTVVIADKRFYAPCGRPSATPTRRSSPAKRPWHRSPQAARPTWWSMHWSDMPDWRRR